MPGMNPPTTMSVTPMQDLVSMLSNREKELDTYLRSLAEDEKNLGLRLEEVRKQMQVSTEDLIKVQRAKAVLRDDEEPVASSFRQDAAYGSDIRIGEKGV